ncbi:MAG: GPW/gp25 family protein [Hyphomicrobiales bacterium]|nr:GPW/gp25 family protein [Hyphomicrobiales bacterium]
MLDRRDIPYKHWSIKVGRADPYGDGAPPPPDAYFGTIVSAVDDLTQAIGNLILTPLGSVPTQPAKGCDIAAWLDRPANVAIPNLTRTIWDALAAWEPRIVVQDVKIEETGYSHFACKVFWRPIESVLDDLRVAEVHFASGATPDRRAA